MPIPAAGFLQETAAIARKGITSGLTDRVFTILSIVIPLNYLVLLVIVVASGARAPIAVVMNGDGPAAQALVNAMGNAHSFSLRMVDQVQAQQLFDDGTVVAVVSIPASLDSDLAARRQVDLPVTVDNVEVDFTDDIRRALPLSITALYNGQFPGTISVQVDERDAHPSEPSYLQYVAVSSALIAVALGGLLIAGTQAAREHEEGTLKTLLLTPASRMSLQCGRLVAGFVLGLATVVLNLGVALAIVGAWPVHPLELIAAVVLLLVLFTALGDLVGNLLRRRAPVIPLCAGMSFFLFAIAGAFQPVSWGNPVVAFVAHLSPTYYGLAVFQDAFYGVASTPQATLVNFAVLGALTAAVIAIGKRRLTAYQVEH